MHNELFYGAYAGTYELVLTRCADPAYILEGCDVPRVHVESFGGDFLKNFPESYSVWQCVMCFFEGFLHNVKVYVCEPVRRQSQVGAEEKQ